MTDTDGGWLLTHFVEDPDGHGEQVFFSLTPPSSPTRWVRLNNGEPVLESHIGTTGVRDPFLVRGADETFLIATDLRVYGGDERDWATWRRYGSRNIVVWRSKDLTTWSDPWLAELAPEGAGMAWAPEAYFDAADQSFVVYWSSTLYASSDRFREEDSYSRILTARTKNFRSFSESTVLIDRGRAVIDTTIVRHNGDEHRISKDDSRSPDSLRLFHEIVESDGPSRILASRIGDDRYTDVEAPMVIHDPLTGRWYLWLDQYSTTPQGYVPLYTDDLRSGRWEFLPEQEYRMPAATKHGGVIAISGAEHDALVRAFPPA